MRSNSNSMIPSTLFYIITKNMSIHKHTSIHLFQSLTLRERKYYDLECLQKNKAYKHHSSVCATIA